MPNLITASEYASRVGQSLRMVQRFANQGRLAGADKPGRDWLIPANTPWPEPLKPGRKPQAKAKAVS